jgi:hypothetical protein
MQRLVEKAVIIPHVADLVLEEQYSHSVVLPSQAPVLPQIV